MYNGQGILRMHKYLITSQDIKGNMDTNCNNYKL